MNPASKIFATALALLLIIMVGGAAALAPTPESLNFGTVEAGTASRVKSLTLSNDEAGAVILAGIASADLNVQYAVTGPEYPIVLLPGEELTVELLYNNPDLVTAQTGILEVIYTNTDGNQVLEIPFTASCVLEGGLPEKPDEGWFLGPCFLGVLFGR